MKIQQLVDYFNDRFVHEHHPKLQPFILKNGQVSGIFGPIRIGSAFLANRPANANESLVGHAAQIIVSPFEQDIANTEIVDAGSLLTDDIDQRVWWK